ncbi:Hypothetical_protein [Hexamita inflata]|uniref:Hypothetical_protein n=1 Tax=Hexamita inflata TaxID=28002 RepID=A0AA86UP62_9EUKA|nr:Hypothetical protein HINF_LOCUS50339 [Hexamita inflata]
MSESSSSSSSDRPVLNPFKSAQSFIQPKSDQMNQQQLFEYQLKQQKRPTPQNLVLKREFKNAIVQTGQINVQTSATFLRDVVVPTVHKSLQKDENQNESNQQKILTDNDQNGTEIQETDSFKEQEQKMKREEQMNQNETNLEETDCNCNENSQTKQTKEQITKKEINVEQLDQININQKETDHLNDQQMKQSQNSQTDETQRKKMMSIIEENAIKIKEIVQNTINTEQLDSKKNIIETSQNEKTNQQENKTHESVIQDKLKSYSDDIIINSIKNTNMTIIMHSSDWNDISNFQLLLPLINKYIKSYMIFAFQYLKLLTFQQKSNNDFKNRKMK